MFNTIVSLRNNLMLRTLGIQERRPISGEVDDEALVSIRLLFTESKVQRAFSYFHSAWD